MTRLLAGTWHPLAFALIGLVYLTCLGSVLAARLAWAGRPSYWLVVLGAFLFLIGMLWGGGYLTGGATFTFTAAGAVMAVFGVALDLIFGQPAGAAGAE
ncbi:MAG TPA: hypothetical protein VJT14_07835 [Candidatus Dormibacteraeota bacterium]|nr:hypothetical protein [Candidatus Dormibacteraeota bacterium]